MGKFEKNIFQESTGKSSCVVLATLLKNRLNDFPDRRLPSFRDLAAEYHVSLSVVQRAMRLLKQESLVKIRRNVGSQIITHPQDSEFFCYGLIEPFPIKHGQTLVTTNTLLQIADEQNINAVPLIRNSSQQAALERECAQKLLKNPFLEGILLFPCKGKKNAAFFTEISKNVPIICIHNELEGADLPAIIFDYERAGHEIACEFKKCGCKKMLLILDKEYENDSITDLKSAISEEMEIVVTQVPFQQMVNARINFDMSFFHKGHLDFEQFVLASGCDCAFSPFDTIFNEMMSSSFIMQMVKNWPLATIASDFSFAYSAYLTSHDLMCWRISNYTLLKCAFDMMINGKKKSSVSKGTTKIALERIR